MSQRAEEPDLHLALIPLTPEARQAVPASRIQIDRLPFRLGRDLREGGRPPFRWFRRERRQTGTYGPNDLYLAEGGRPYRVSRTHLLIDREQGRYFIEDRRSACGTLVGGEALGGRRTGGRRWLEDGDVIIVGGNHSPFVFKFDGNNGSGD